MRHGRCLCGTHSSLLVPSLLSLPWSFCTSLGEPREHSSAIALTPLPSLSCLPLALLCARTTLFARVSLYRADSHDFRLVLHRRALLAWPTCFSFGGSCRAPLEGRRHASPRPLPSTYDVCVDSCHSFCPFSLLFRRFVPASLSVSPSTLLKDRYAS